MLKCSTSLWSADLANLASEIKRVEPYSERFHLDVAGGHYVPSMLFRSGDHRGDTDGDQGNFDGTDDLRQDSGGQGRDRQVFGQGRDSGRRRHQAQFGFFSDAYCVEWSYAKAALVRKILARVLADRVDVGQFDVPGALAFARAILFDSPQSLLGMVPRSLDQTELR
jgi:hypothetical protein